MRRFEVRDPMERINGCCMVGRRERNGRMLMVGRKDKVERKQGRKRKTKEGTNEGRKEEDAKRRKVHPVQQKESYRLMALVSAPCRFRSHFIVAGGR